MGTTKPLTKAERSWLEEVQAVLDRCPSKRLAFATIGDCDVTVYDQTRVDEISKMLDRGSWDFIPAANSLGAVFDVSLNFPAPVESTAG